LCQLQSLAKALKMPVFAAIEMFATAKMAIVVI
jgi:hypothetical protein